MHTRDPDGIRTVHTAHVRTHGIAIVPPPDIAPRLGEHGGSTMQIATCGHTLAARVRILCMANAPLPVRGSRVQCDGDCTSGIRFGRAAPPHWLGSMQQRRCAAYWAYQMLGRCAPLTGLGMWCYQLLVCVARVCAHVCVYMSRCPGASGKCAKVVCVCESCVCVVSLLEYC